MTKSGRTLAIISSIGLGLMALATSGTATAAPTTEARMMHESVVVTAIDRTARKATLQNSDGETRTVDVPTEVKSFDTLKVGDHVDIDYYESIAMEVLPAGTKPTMSESSAVKRMGHGVGAGSRQMTVSATVISVDPTNNKVTFKGPRGNVRTVTVENPEVQAKLPSLKVGQVVQITYSEAMAASIRPSAPGSSK
jgi:hypothetical protein